jgi:hypothetical protein
MSGTLTNVAEYSLVRGLRRAPCGLELRLDTQRYRAHVSKAAAYCLVRGAEDKRFELLRACTQHAFQVCASGFAVGQEGPLPRAPVVRDVRRTILDVAE